MGSQNWLRVQKRGGDAYEGRTVVVSYIDEITLLGGNYEFDFIKFQDLEM